MPEGFEAARRLAPKRGVSVGKPSPAKAGPAKAGPAGGRRVGRPPRIDRAAIAAAAADMPLEEITLRSVAERLGVSVPSLYHYVSGRADLLRLAAEESAVRMTLPEDRGQHWAAWCYEWADYVRSAFVADPALLGEFLNGAFGPEWMAGHMDTAIGVCARGGLPDRAGLEAFVLVSECALGAAISEIHFGRAAADGQPAEVELSMLAYRGAAEMPNLHRLSASGSLDQPSFAARITAVLTGIAARHGAESGDIARLVEEASRARR